MLLSLTCNPIQHIESPPRKVRRVLGHPAAQIGRIRGGDPRKQEPRLRHQKRGSHAKPKGLEPSVFGSTVRCKPASEGQKRGKSDELVSGLFSESGIDPDLRTVIETWPRLSDDIRAAILRIVGH